MTTKRELLPCPFCGGESRAQKYFGHWVGCDDCDAQGPGADSEVGAIAAWNRRAALAQPAQAVESQEAVVAKLLQSWCDTHGKAMPWAKAVELTAIVMKLSDAERVRLHELDAAPQPAPACQPTLTVCPRCNNDISKCDGIMKPARQGLTGLGPAAERSTDGGSVEPTAAAEGVEAGQPPSTPSTAELSDEECAKIAHKVWRELYPSYDTPQWNPTREEFALIRAGRATVAEDAARYRQLLIDCYPVIDGCGAGHLRARFPRDIIDAARGKP